MVTKAQIDRIHLKLSLLRDQHLPRASGFDAFRLRTFIRLGLAFVALMYGIDRYDRARGGQWLA